MLTDDVHNDVPSSRSRLSYKYQRLRERLRDAVTNGELAGKLPGERELARRFGANAKTINKALNDLAIDGLIIRHVGRGTFVSGAASEPSAPMQARKFGWLIPDGGNHEYRDGVYRRAVTLLQAGGHRLDKIVMSLDAGGELSLAGLRPGMMRELHGAVICGARPSRELLAGLRRCHLPVILVNNHHDQIRTPVVMTDYAHGAFRLTEHLVQLGHRQIRLLICPDDLPAAAAAEGGYRAVMQRHGLRCREAAIATKPFDWAGLLSESDRPTALVCTCAQLAHEASRRAVDAGFTQPSMLGVACLCEPGDTLPAEHSITAYEVDVDRVTHWATQLLLSASAGQAPQMVILPGRLIDRGSAAPPITGPQPVTDTPGEAVI